MKLKLMLLPLAGLVVGYALAHIAFTGLYETWRPVPGPGLPLAQIEGVQQGRILIVATADGRRLALPLRDGDEVLAPEGAAWGLARQAGVDRPGGFRYYGADFTILPPLFRARQVFDYEYLYDWEGKGQVRFALAEDGRLWVWSHAIGGMTGLVYTFYPAAGCLLGLLAAAAIAAAAWIRRGRAPGGELPKAR